jgi:hypothetical protein
MPLPAPGPALAWPGDNAPVGVRTAAVAAATIGLAVGAELALRRRRPRTRYGRYADWVHPGGSLGAPTVGLANSRLARALCERLPVPAMASDITDVVYVNYAVPADRLVPLVPPGLRLQRVGSDGGWAVLSFLTYRHGHLGPVRLGPMRRLLPSPVQTNWRIYVRDPCTGLGGVYFVTNAVDHPAYALGARLLCEAMPMHLLRRAAVGPDEFGSDIVLRLDPGIGSGPHAEAVLRPAPIPDDGPWRPAFGGYREMLTHVVPQDRALSVQPWHRRITRQEILLDIAPEDCLPLAGAVYSDTARGLVGDAEPFSFLIRHVAFRFDREEYDRFGQVGVANPPWQRDRLSEQHPQA